MNFFVQLFEIGINYLYVFNILAIVCIMNHALTEIDFLTH